MKLSIALQAGGESSRMGRNKAPGVPLIQRVCTRLAGCGDERIVTTHHPEELAIAEAWALLQEAKDSGNLALWEDPGTQ